MNPNAFLSVFICQNGINEIVRLFNIDKAKDFNKFFFSSVISINNRF